MKVLSGIQPSGELHIGNYFGSIKDMVERQNDNDVMAFIANYHALSTTSGEKLKNLTFNCAIDFLALGINPNKSVFWVQSDVKEVLELYWILSSFTPLGLLERAHSYKDKVAKGIPASHCLFSYPVLMSADILLFDSEIVPVGKDQIQHLEIARDIATKFNNQYGDIFTLPKYYVNENLATIIGLDGEKMSKSYNNTIDIFLDGKILKKRVSKIQTDSTPLESPKEFDKCNVYNIIKPFLDEKQISELQDRYTSGGSGYGHFKSYLSETMDEYFKPFREKREYYQNNPQLVKDILENGANQARAIAKDKMEIIKEAVGIL